MGGEARVVLDREWIDEDCTYTTLYRQEFYQGEAEDQGKVLRFTAFDGQTCLTTKEWTPLEPGHIERKTYCSDRTAGALTHVEQLKGKTVAVELLAVDVTPPGLPAGPPSPVPTCLG